VQRTFSGSLVLLVIVEMKRKPNPQLNRMSRVRPIRKTHLIPLGREGQFQRVSWSCSDYTEII